MKVRRRGRRTGKRLKLVTVTLAGGLALLLGAGASIVTARESDDGGRKASSAGGLYTPKINPKAARQAAVKYLTSRGVPRAKAALRIQRQTGQIRAAAKLRKQAPDSVPSVWIDDSGTLMAAVVNKDGERAARAAGAKPERVTVSVKELEEIRDKLAQDAKDNPPRGLSGASFEIDPVKGKVIAEYLFRGAEPVVPKAATRFGDTVVASAKYGESETLSDVDISGANMKRDPDEDTGVQCTAAWAVDIEDPNGGGPGNGMMTAGHCFDPDKDAKQNKFDIDTTAAGNTQATGEFATFGAAGDYGYARLERDRGSTVMATTGKVVEAVEEPVKGATVCKDGATSGETCGEITRVGVTRLERRNGVQYLLKGMARANFRAEKGDSGGPVYTDFANAKGPLGIAALGILSAGHQRKSGSYVMYFTPLSGIDSQGKFFVRIDGG